MRLVALFALLSFTACAQQKATPKKRVAVASTGAAASEAARAEALWKAGRFQDAVYAFQASIKANPDDPKTRVRLGDLFRERFQPKDAGELYGEALEIDESYVPALMGLARVFAEGWDRRAEELAHKAAKLAPQDAEPLELLARLAAEDSNFTLAVEQADKALALSPNAFEAMGVRGAIEILEDRNPSPWLERALKADPARGQAYNVAGELLVINRRYNEGIDLFRKATEVQPTFWEARARLGVNLMRLGKDEEARRELELCYENGYKSNPVVNTLRLMDSYKNFKTFRTDRAIVRLHKKEADVLEPYIVPEVERVMSAYDKKYGYTMKTPVQLEVYPDHEDFAVRTMGMPGLGALGVSFGPVVAMDSPSGRKAGSFHWASTLWHEMSHVYALAITNYRVPRWFTEGLAVYEETAVSPDWGDRLDPPTIVAIRDKKLLPVEKLDRGFIRPSYPAQVTVSYFQGGRICSYIAQNWGYPKLIEMLNDYGKGETTAKIFPARLGIAPAEFDKRFIEWVEKETEKTVSGFKDWQGKLKTLVAASREEKWDAVLSAGPALRDIYPEYVEAGNVYELIYRAHLAKNDKPAAMAELKRYSKAAGRDPDLLKALAKLEEESGDKKAAAATLNRLLYIAPAQDEELHRRLGDLLIEQGDHLGAVREYRAVVASKPVNPAAAYYSLARAYRSAHQPERAKEALFAALEAAPGYRPAQKMLLELSSAK